MGATLGLLKQKLSQIPTMLWLLLLAAAVLIFYQITHVDMIGDNALYSTRSIGLVDYLFSDNQFQPTPLTWYETTPWWTALSFHDHPLGLFIFQNLFFKFGHSVFWAKLPYALFALGTIFLTFVSTRKLAGEKAGLLAALFLIFNYRFIWFARSASMESGVLFFLAMAWFGFLLYREDKKWWWFFGLTSGFLSEVKFTALFLPAAIIVYLLIKDRSRFKTKHFWLAMSVAFLVALPELIYNALMYLDTGHFALQLSRLLHQSSPWTLAGISGNPISNLSTSLVDLGLNVSWPYFAAALAAVVYVAFKSHLRWLLILPIIFIAAEDATFGSKDLYSIFLASIMAVATNQIWHSVASLAWANNLCQIIFFTLCVYFTVFLVASTQPRFFSNFTTPGWWRANGSGVQNYGLLQLDSYISRVILKDNDLTYFELFGKVKTHSFATKKYLYPLSLEELKTRLQNAKAVIYDANINWNARVWLFDRRRFYDNAPFFSTTEDTALSQMHLNDFYFIKAEPAAILDPAVFQNNLPNVVEQNLLAKQVMPDIIYRDDGQAAFKIYHVLNFGK